MCTISSVVRLGRTTDLELSVVTSKRLHDPCPELFSLVLPDLYFDNAFQIRRQLVRRQRCVNKFFYFLRNHLIFSLCWS